MGGIFWTLQVEITKFRIAIYRYLISPADPTMVRVKGPENIFTILAPSDWRKEKVVVDYQLQWRDR